MWKLIPSESTCCTRSNVTVYHHFLGAAPTTIEQYQPVQSDPQKIESLNRALSQHHGCPGATVNQIFVFFLPLSLSL